MKIHKMKHEEKVCEAILPILNKRRNENFQKVAAPDKERKNRREEAIEFIWQGRSSGYVVEHTRIESYKRQIEDDHRFSRLMFPLEEKLSHALPSPGYYELSIPVKASLERVNFDQVRSSIECWVRDKAVNLKLGQGITENPEGVPFEVYLYREEGAIQDIEGKCLVSRSSSGNFESDRGDRLKEALDRKCPKLRKWKEQTGLRSILILESNDIALSNHLFIGRSLIPEFIKRSDLPDEVYSVETGISLWSVWILKEDDQVFPQIKGQGPYYIE